MSNLQALFLMLVACAVCFRMGWTAARKWDEAEPPVSSPLDREPDHTHEWDMWTMRHRLPEDEQVRKCRICGLIVWRDIPHIDDDDY
jgi:hypothetical protein